MGGWNWWPAVGGNAVGLASLGPRPTAPATLFFDFFSDGSCFGSCVLVFSLVFHMVPATFRMIKSKKWLTFPSRFQF